MPESKPSEPPGDSTPSAPRLSDKAPPKPRRRGSSIPPALVVSKAAAKVLPAPRPPRPARLEKQARQSAPEASPAHAEGSPGLRSEAGKSERPVTATVTEGNQQTSSKRGFAPLALMAAAGVVGVLVWTSQQQPTVAESKTQKHHPIAASGPERSASPTDKKSGAAQPSEVRMIDLDEPEAPATAQPASASKLSTKSHRPVAPTDAQAGTSLAPATEATPDAPDPEATQSSEQSREGDVEVAIEPEGEQEAEVADAERAPSAEKAQLPPFDAQAAKLALGDGASQASSCRRGDDPRGTAEVLITFAPSGRVTSANVHGAPFGGTQTGGCVAAAMRQATVPPFSGDHVVVRKLVKVH